jgi:hypothetical protein
LIKLVGGVTETFVVAPVPVEVLLPQAAVASATASKTDGMTINGRFMSFSSLKSHRALAQPPCQGCVRIVDGYTMMQTDWQDPLCSVERAYEGGWGCQKTWSSQ